MAGGWWRALVLWGGGAGFRPLMTDLGSVDLPVTAHFFTLPSVWRNQLVLKISLELKSHLYDKY